VTKQEPSVDSDNLDHVISRSGPSRCLIRGTAFPASALAKRADDGRSALRRTARRRGRLKGPHSHAKPARANLLLRPGFDVERRVRARVHALQPAVGRFHRLDEFGIRPVRTVHKAVGSLNRITVEPSRAARNWTNCSGVSIEKEMTTETPRRALLVAFSLSVMFVSGWITFVHSQSPPIERRVSNVALSATGRWLASGTPRGRITIWDQRGGAPPRQFDFPHGPLNDLRFSPDEHLLAIASKDLGIYAPERPAAPQLVRSDEKNYGTVRFSPDGQFLLVITGTGVIETIDIRSGGARLKVCCSSIYGEVAFTPDGHAIANAGHWPRVWDARSGELVGQLTRSRQFYTFGPIAFDAGRGTILMGSQDGRVYAWKLSTRQLVGMSAPQSPYVQALAVSMTGWVAYAGFGNIVRLWNPLSGQQRTLAAARPTSSIILGPGGTSIIFGTADGRIESWDTETGQRLSAMRTPGP
jgi:WD40 repeat protein